MAVLNASGFLISSSNASSNLIKSISVLTLNSTNFLSSNTNAYANISVVQPIKTTISTFSSGYLDPTTSSKFISYLSLTLTVKSNATEKFSQIDQSVPYSTINVIKNSLLLQGTQNWVSLGGSLSVAGLSAPTNANSFVTTDTDTGASSGVYQNFSSSGGIYTLSAYVQNLAGLTPRPMYLQIAWVDGTFSQSTPVYVNNTDGWVRLTLTASGPQGAATAYIITTNPGGSETGDSAAINGVMLDLSQTVDAFIPSTYPVGTIAPVTTNATANIKLNTVLIQQIQTVSNANLNLNIINSTIRSSAGITSSGYFDPTISSIGTNTISSIAFGLSNAALKPTFISSPALIIQSNPNTLEKFNFQTVLKQTVNATVDADSQPAVVFSGKAIASDTALGYFDTSLVSVMTPLAISGTLISNSNSYSKLLFISTLSLISQPQTNTLEKFNFQTVLKQTANATANADSQPSVVFSGKSQISTSSSGYIVPTIYGSNISLIAGAKSYAVEKFSQIDIIPSYSTINILKNGSFGSNAYWYSLGGSANVNPLVYPAVSGNSLVTIDTDTGANSGIYQNFNSSNGIYTFSAYVQNLTGLTPRRMYLQIAWVDGTFSQSTPVYVNNTDGWVRLTLTASGPQGAATAYIITTNPGGSETGDSAAISNALLDLSSTVDAYIDPTYSLGTLAFINSNATEKFILKTNVIQSVNTEINANFQPSVIFNGKSNISTIASGYIDPAIATINGFNLSLNLIANTNGLIKPITTISPTAVIQSQSSVSEKFNFQTVLKQTVNATVDADSQPAVVFSGKAIASDTALGYFDTSLVSVMTPLAISGTLISNSNSYSKLLFISTLSLISQPQTNTLEKFNFQTVLKQTANATANADSQPSVVFSGKSQISTISAGYFDPTLANTFNAQLLLIAGIESNGFEKFDLVQVFEDINSNLILNAIVNTSAIEKINFKSVINQSINTSSNANNQISFVSSGKATASITAQGYFDPTISTVGNTSLVLNALATPSGTSKIAILSQITDGAGLIVTSLPNTFEKLTFKSNLIQQVQAESSLFTQPSFVTRIISPANATVSGYIDPTITSIGNFNLSLNATLTSNGTEKFDLIQVFEDVNTNLILNATANTGGKELFRNISVLAQQIQSYSNSIEAISAKSIIKQQVIAESILFAAPTFNTNIVNSINVQGNAKELFSSIDVVAPVQPGDTQGPIVFSDSFENGIGSWSGVNNLISISNSSAQDGSYSLQTQNINTYDEYQPGPVGAKRSFTVVQGINYTLSAYVNNVSGVTPRNMYVYIVWSNGVSSQGQLVSVTEDGTWYNVNVGGTAPISGTATAYIITSTPFDSLNGDIGLIDSVSITSSPNVVITNPITLSAKVGGREAFVFNNKLSSQIESNANLYSAPSYISRFIVQTANAEVNGYIDPTISSIGNTSLSFFGAVKSNGFIALDPIYLSASSNIVSSSNAKEAFKYTSVIPSYAQISVNSNEKISVNSVIKQQANAQSIVSISTASTINISSSIAITSNATEQFDLIQVFEDYNTNLILNSVATPGAKEKFVFINSLSLQSETEANSIEKIILNSKVSSTISTQSNGLLDFSQQALTLPISGKITTSGELSEAINLVQVAIQTFANAIVIPNAKEKFNFQTILSQSLNTVVNGNSQPSTIYNGKSTISTAASGYFDPSTYSIDQFRISSNAIANVSGFIQSSATLDLQNINIVADANAKEKLSLQTLVIQSAQANVNSVEKFVTNYKLVQNVNTQSNASDLLSTNPASISLGKLILISKSNATEAFSRVIPAIIEPVVIPGNLLQDPSFEFGGQFWSGIINSVSTTTAYSYDGISSLLIQGLPEFAGQEVGPLGAKQDFKSYAGTTFTLSAQVQIIGGTPSRSVYAEIQWSNGQVVQGPITLANKDGNWYNVTVSGVSPFDGPATAYIITSSPFDSISGDLAVIDAVSLTASNPVQITLNGIANVNGREKIALQSVLTQSINSEINAIEKFVNISKIISQVAQASTDADSIFNIVNSTIKAISGVNSNVFINTSATLDLQNINATELSNGRAAPSIVNSILSATAGINSNATEKISFVTKVVSQAETTVGGYADTNVNFSDLSRLAVQAVGYVGGTVQTSTTLDLQNINIVADTNVKEKFSFQTLINQSSNAIVNANSIFNIVNSTIRFVAGASSNGYFDPTLSSTEQFNLSKLFAGVLSNASIQSSAILDQQNQNIFVISSGKEKVVSQSVIAQTLNTTANATDKLFTQIKIAPLYAQAVAGSLFDLTVIPLLAPQSLGAIIGIAKSNATEAFSIPYPIQPQPLSSSGNLLNNPSFEYDSADWSGINNSYTRTSSYATDGLYSVLVANIQTYDGVEVGPIGIKQSFYAIAGTTYNLYADVQNISGNSPRNMYVQISWANGTYSQSIPVSVDGNWTDLQVSGLAPISGYATAYVVTSTPLNSINGSSAVIDNVAVNIVAVPQVNLNIIANPLGREKLSAISSISQSSSSIINGIANVAETYKLNLVTANIQSFGLIDTSVLGQSLIKISGIAAIKSNAIEAFSAVDIIQPSVLTFTVDLIAKTNALVGNFAQVSSIQNVSIFSNSNTLDKSSFISKIVSQSQGVVGGYADTNVNFSDLSRLSIRAVMSSDADIQTSATLDLQNINATELSNGKAVASIVNSSLSATAGVNSNATEKISFVTKVVSQAETTVGGYADTNVNFSDLSRLAVQAVGYVGGTVQTSATLDLQNINATELSNGKAVASIVNSSLSATAGVNSNATEKFDLVEVIQVPVIAPPVFVPIVKLIANVYSDAQEAISQNIKISSSINVSSVGTVYIPPIGINTIITSKANATISTAFVVSPIFNISANSDANIGILSVSSKITPLIATATVNGGGYVGGVPSGFEPSLIIPEFSKASNTRVGGNAVLSTSYSITQSANSRGYTLIKIPNIYGISSTISARSFAAGYKLGQAQGFEPTLVETTKISAVVSMSVGAQSGDLIISAVLGDFIGWGQPI